MKIQYGITVIYPEMAARIYTPPITWKDRVIDAIYAVWHFMLIIGMCLLIGIGAAISPQGFLTGFVTGTVMMRR